LKIEILNLINEINSEISGLEDLNLDELEERCAELGQTSLDGYVYALEKIATKLGYILNG